MANNKNRTTKPENSEIVVTEQKPRSLAVAKVGIKTDTDFANLMSSLMSDIIEGRVSPSVGNATCNAGGKLLKVVEMRYKYGLTDNNGKQKTLTLALESGD